jgi:hypothetical protein
VDLISDVNRERLRQVNYMRNHASAAIRTKTRYLALGITLLEAARLEEPLLVNRSFPTLSLRVLPEMPGPVAAVITSKKDLGG